MLKEQHIQLNAGIENSVVFAMYCRDGMHLLTQTIEFTLSLGAIAGREQLQCFS